MNDGNIIKPKLLHVQQDFYQELINGFSAQGQKSDLAKQSQVIKMSFPQAFRFKNKVLPIIMKQVEKKNLLQDYYSFNLERKRQKLVKDFRQNFLVSYVEIQKEQQQIQENIQEKQTKSTFWKVVKMARTYNSVRNMITFYRKFVVPVWDSTILSTKVENYNNSTFRQQKEKQLFAAVHGQEPALINVLQIGLYPVFHELYKIIDEKCSGIWTKFIANLIESILLPDWDDPLDVAAWGLSVAATVASTIASPLTGGASLGIPATVWGIRINKALNVVKKVGGFIKRMSSGMKIRGMGRLRRAGLSLNRGLTRYRTFMNTTTGGEWVGHVLTQFKNARRYKTQVQFLANGIDYYYTDEKNVNDMMTAYTERLRPHGQRAMRRVQAKMEGVVSAVDDIERMYDDLGNRLSQQLKNLTISEGAVGAIERRYGVVIKFKGLSNNPYTDVLKMVSRKIRTLSLPIQRKTTFYTQDSINIFDSFFSNSGEKLRKVDNSYIFTKKQFEYTITGKQFKIKALQQPIVIHAANGRFIPKTHIEYKNGKWSLSVVGRKDYNTLHNNLSRWVGNTFQNGDYSLSHQQQQQFFNVIGQNNRDTWRWYNSKGTWWQKVNDIVKGTYLGGDIDYNISDAWGQFVQANGGRTQYTQDQLFQVIAYNREEYNDNTSFFQYVANMLNRVRAIHYTSFVIVLWLLECGYSRQTVGKLLQHSGFRDFGKVFTDRFVQNGDYLFNEEISSYDFSTVSEIVEQEYIQWIYSRNMINGFSFIININVTNVTNPWTFVDVGNKGLRLDYFQTKYGNVGQHSGIKFNVSNILNVSNDISNAQVEILTGIQSIREKEQNFNSIMMALQEVVDQKLKVIYNGNS